MRALDCLYVEVQGACFGGGADGGIAAVGEGTGLTIAKARDVVFIAAEGLVFCCFELVAAELSGVVSVRWVFLERLRECVLVDHLPHYLVRRHRGR